MKKKWWRRKPFDPTKSGSWQQQNISTAINEALQSESDQRRRTIDVLVLGTTSATTCFLNHFDRDRPRPSPASQRLDLRFDAANATSPELTPSIESELAELAGELYRMSLFSEYQSPHEGTHEVDVLASSYLLNAMYAKASLADKSALRCAIRPARTAIENQVHHQTSTIDTTTLPARSYPSTDFKFNMHLLGEQSPAHPKTHGFFENCRDAIFVVDINTLHELHPIGKVTNAVWAIHRLSTLNYRCSRRQICVNFHGAAQFSHAMVNRSPDEYLARLFDDYSPEGNVTRYDNPAHTVLAYVLSRFNAALDVGQPFLSFFGNEEVRYASVYEAIIEQYVTRYMVCTLL